MPQFILGEKSTLFTKLGLPFGWMFDDGNVYSVLTEQDGHLLVDDLLKDRGGSEEEISALKTNITASNLAPDINAIIKLAKDQPIPEDHLWEAMFESCPDPNCEFTEVTGLIHAAVLYDKLIRSVFSIEEVILFLFQLNRREIDQNPLGPSDAIHIIVEAANSGLVPNQADLQEHLNTLNPLIAMKVKMMMFAMHQTTRI